MHSLFLSAALHVSREFGTSDIAVLSYTARSLPRGCHILCLSSVSYQKICTSTLHQVDFLLYLLFKYTFLIELIPKNYFVCFVQSTSLLSKIVLKRSSYDFLTKHSNFVRLAAGVSFCVPILNLVFRNSEGLSEITETLK